MTCRPSDPDDDYLVALAIREHADALISGDHDLTAIDLTDVSILTPAHALRRLNDTLPSAGTHVRGRHFLKTSARSEDPAFLTGR